MNTLHQVTGTSTVSVLPIWSLNNGPGQYPVAIVELMDGTVEEVTVDLLRFTSEPSKE